MQLMKHTGIHLAARTHWPQKPRRGSIFNHSCFLLFGSWSCLYRISFIYVLRGGGYFQSCWQKIHWVWIQEAGDQGFLTRLKKKVLQFFSSSYLTLSQNREGRFNIFHHSKIFSAYFFVTHRNRDTQKRQPEMGRLFPCRSPSTSASCLL